MKQKTYTYFTFKDLEGNEFSVACWTNHHQYGFTHNINCMGVKARVCWCNRTWESFTYESVLKRWAEKIGGNFGAYLNVQIDAIAKHKSEEADAWFNAFKKRYDNLHENTKQHLANSGVMVNSVEEAESVMAISEAFDLLLNK